MGIFPRQKLYRRPRLFVILAATLACAGTGLAQTGPKQPAYKGPRALGLLELAPNGKSHLVPVTILLDGKFYDASAYKAAPVPMALESGTVYEAVKTGVSLGLFTVTAAGQVQGKEQSNWIGEGTWKPAGSEPAPKKPAAAHKPSDEDLDRPPVLRRAGAEKSGAPAPAPQPSPTPVTQSSAPAPPPGAAPSPLPSPTPPSVEETEADDKDRPMLHRGKPAPRPAEKMAVSNAAAVKPPAAQTTPAVVAKPGPVQIIPAISDAGGPEPRPFTYSLKPEEEQALRKKMLALAADEVRARDRQLTGEDPGATQGRTAPSRSKSAPQAKRAATRLPQPVFEDVDLQVFDLSNSNEPALVLTAKAHMPPRPGAPAKNIEYFVTLVARQEVDAELHKAFVNITDTLHLDAIPRMELIDAVDADGDGRGELLFRQTSDAGSAFVVYRVIGEQLWPLFQGTPE
jgi:hypothetical protein